MYVTSCITIYYYTYIRIATQYFWNVRIIHIHTAYNYMNRLRSSIIDYNMYIHMFYYYVCMYVRMYKCIALFA